MVSINKSTAKRILAAQAKVASKAKPKKRK